MKNLFPIIFNKKINKENNYNQIINKLNKKKINLAYLLLPILAYTIIIFVAFQKKENASYYNGLPVNYVYSCYAYDTSTPNKAVAVSKYVFIAKINNILRTDYFNPTEVKKFIFKKTIYHPYTVYDVDVIYNLKGELVNDVELTHFGGINKDQKSYTFDASNNGFKFLNDGEYYIVLASTFYYNDSLIITGSNEDSLIPLGNIDDDVMNDILNNKEVDAKYNYVVNKINEYKLAIKNEELPNDNSSILDDLLNKISKYDVNYKN